MRVQGDPLGHWPEMHAAMLAAVVQELKQLYQEAVAELPAEPAVVSLAETTYKEAFQAHNMEGMQWVTKLCWPEAAWAALSY